MWKTAYKTSFEVTQWWGTFKQIQVCFINLLHSLTLLSLASWGGEVIQSGGSKIYPLPPYLFSKTKNDINLRLNMVVVFYINFQKIMFIVSYRWLFWWRHHSYFMSHGFLCFAIFSRNFKCFHFKSVLNFFLGQIYHFDITYYIYQSLLAPYYYQLFMNKQENQTYTKPEVKKKQWF